MLFIALGCAIAAVVLFLLWIGRRRALSAETASLDRTRAELARSDAQKAELEDTVTKLTDDVSTAATERESLAEQLETATTELEAAKAAIDLATATAEATQEQIDRLTAELAASSDEVEQQTAWAVRTQAELDEMSKVAATQAVEINELALQAEAAEEALVEAQDAASRRRETAVPPVLLANSEDGTQLEVPGFSPATAWQLELVRSDRTWRYSVASNPVEDSSPFEDTDNPLRLAIEIEALALREDVGAFIGIRWEASNLIDPEVDPARAHLTLRLAQEMLAAAAREAEPSELWVSVGPNGGLSMKISALDGDDIDFKIPPPPIASEWIDVDEHGGLVVTVKPR